MQNKTNSLTGTEHAITHGRIGPSHTVEKPSPCRGVRLACTKWTDYKIVCNRESFTHGFGPIIVCECEGLRKRFVILNHRHSWKITNVLV
jgi:hypothetical protein